MIQSIDRNRLPCQRQQVQAKVHQRAHLSPRRQVRAKVHQQAHLSPHRQVQVKVP